MKMEEMKAYFKERGFECTYRRNSTYDAYDFEIEKKGCLQRGVYKWPHDQKDFMDHMIRDFERTFKKNTEVKPITRGTAETLRKEMFKGTDFATVIIGDKEYPVRLTNVTIDKSMYTGEEARIECELCEVAEYLANDAQMTRDLFNRYNPFAAPKIKNVIHNDPATIVFWSDGTKTVVKCQDDDVYDAEKGLAMAICKKVLGNKGNYCNEIKKWLPKED